MPHQRDTAREAAQIAQSTAYPPAPWVMEGVWLWSVHPVRRSRAASQLPAPLKPLWLPAGRTLGFSLIGQYGPGSTLHYGEAACGLILSLGPRPAIWISGLVVDSPASVAGGRNIWR
ncbi:MAG TPA: acetoacetate decarboxylase family protein, partial [Herpetosiphonaceae bacterium]|nr:acetoacetate decarboxylase family protein [Herpetosiphonaceae bacterium]